MPAPLSRSSLEDFLDQLASNAATPGGGSTAALAGALGAGLVSMVGNLTMGRPTFTAVEEEIGAMVAQSEALRRRLTSLIEADARAFEHVTQAMRMPRETDAAQAARTEALQDSLKAAAIVPLQIADACREVMTLAQQAAADGNPNVISDAGVAMLMAESALRSAALNVLINLKFIQDKAFVDEHRSQLERLLEEAPDLRENLYTTVLSELQ